MRERGNPSQRGRGEVRGDGGHRGTRETDVRLCRRWKQTLAPRILIFCFGGAACTKPMRRLYRETKLVRLRQSDRGAERNGFPSRQGHPSPETLAFVFLHARDNADRRLGRQRCRVNNSSLQLSGLSASPLETARKRRRRHCAPGHAACLCVHNST